MASVEGSDVLEVLRLVGSDAVAGLRTDFWGHFYCEGIRLYSALHQAVLVAPGSIGCTGRRLNARSVC